MMLLYNSIWKYPDDIGDLSYPSLRRLLRSLFTASWYTRGMQSRGCLSRTSPR